jgi:hypothetical protein
VADASDFDEVVDALYALPPAEFVAAREERAKAARSAGDRGLAARIHALRRPTLGAWMVNLLAHERPELLRQLVELGRELREAQEGLRGEDLRTLNSQRQQVVAALVGEARTLARAEGERASDEAAYEVERTLLAALADPKAGEEVTTGTLVHPLDYAGFGPVGAAGMVRPDARPRRVRRGDRPARAPAGPASDNDLTAARRRRERAEAEAALRAAETEQRQAATRAKRSAERATDAESRRQEADAEIGRLSRELHAAQSVAAAAQELERHARTKATEAAVEAEEAAERHAEARRRLDELPRAEL